MKFISCYSFTAGFVVRVFKTSQISYLEKRGYFKKQGCGEGWEIKKGTETIKGTKTTKIKKN